MAILPQPHPISAILALGFASKPNRIRSQTKIIPTSRKFSPLTPPICDIISRGGVGRYLFPAANFDNHSIAGRDWRKTSIWCCCSWTVSSSCAAFWVNSCSSATSCTRCWRLCSSSSFEISTKRLAFSSIPFLLSDARAITYRGVFFSRSTKTNSLGFLSTTCSTTLVLSSEKMGHILELQ